MSHLSLNPAVRLAILNGTRRDEIKVPKWAETYAVSEAKVRKVWAEELERHERDKTKIPPATISDDAIGEGK